MHAEDESNGGLEAQGIYLCCRPSRSLVLFLIFYSLIHLFSFSPSGCGEGARAAHPVQQGGDQAEGGAVQLGHQGPPQNDTGETHTHTHTLSVDL